MVTDFRVAQPLEFYRTFLREDVRPDGRELSESRATHLNIGCIGTADGSALVKLGNTTIMCGVKAEFACPTVNEPKLGFLVPNVELPPLCSSQYKVGPPSDHAQVVSQLVMDIIASSKLVDLESLCIAEGSLSWVLHCDMVCLDYDGNIVDACLIALLAALRNVRLPSVHIDDSSGIAETSWKKCSSLKLSCHPVSTSFAVFDDIILLVDPTKEEEILATGEVTVVTNEDGDLCGVYKPGGSPLKVDDLRQCIIRSKQRTKKVLQLVKTTLESATLNNT